jgi:hypothetical protein
MIGPQHNFNSQHADTIAPQLSQGKHKIFI